MSYGVTMNALPYGYHMLMARTQTLVQLSDELIALLDAEATRRGVSRSALIREAVAAYLSDVTDEIERWRLGYERIPAGTPDDWGNLEPLTDAASAEAFRALDEAP